MHTLRSAAARILRVDLFRRALFTGLLGLFLLGAFGAAQAAGKSKAAYDYYLTGSAVDVVRPAPDTPTAVLMGGGPDVDAAFQWMIQKSGGGNFVVIRASGADGYNPYIYAMGGLSSVETLVIQNREAAADPFVLERVARAEALFIAGGDQADYIQQWKGTPLDAAIQALMQRNVPIGGTSAGLAVLGQFDFAALRGTVTSAQALADPYNRYMKLDQGFLTGPGLGGVLADAHLDARDRMGRLLTFVARTVQDGWAPVAAARGIGVDVETALLVEGRQAMRVGVGSAYFLSPTIAPTTCLPGQPLTFRNVIVQRLSGGGSFDLTAWSGVRGAAAVYDISAEAGVLTSSQSGGSVY
ncbi:cyanophycinase [Ramlibacter sp. 2FC]|uniref:cyanophycinase n=1 Tax=Ramlibacter sp. 2FC TaxID=2502188 RepID=UPI001485BFFE|nr:cyanophycinase [Ramlibacter sp. 2FC]